MTEGVRTARAASVRMNRVALGGRGLTVAVGCMPPALSTCEITLFSHLSAFF
jgi:hypothetical protein